MTRRADPPHDASALYTLALVFSARASGSVREANAAEPSRAKTDPPA